MAEHNTEIDYHHVAGELAFRLAQLTAAIALVRAPIETHRSRLLLSRPEVHEAKRAYQGSRDLFPDPDQEERAQR
jgi:hypothetical protein